jgi:hypothetical protein
MIRHWFPQAWQAPGRFERWDHYIRGWVPDAVSEKADLVIIVLVNRHLAAGMQELKAKQDKRERWVEKSYLDLFVAEKRTNLVSIDVRSA